MASPAHHISSTRPLIWRSKFIIHLKQAPHLSIPVHHILNTPPPPLVGRDRFIICLQHGPSILILNMPTTATRATLTSNHNNNYDEDERCRMRAVFLVGRLAWTRNKGVQQSAWVGGLGLQGLRFGTQFREPFITSHVVVARY